MLPGKNDIFSGIHLLVLMGWGEARPTLLSYPVWSTAHIAGYHGTKPFAPPLPGAQARKEPGRSGGLFIPIS
jgi:hypothetical protein